MELRRYWNIVIRRAWIILCLLALVLVTYLLFTPEPQTSYTTGMRFVVGIKPEAQGDYYAYDRYYTWLTAEYLVDDLSEVVKSQAFSPGFRANCFSWGGRRLGGEGISILSLQAFLL